MPFDLDAAFVGGDIGFLHRKGRAKYEASQMVLLKSGIRIRMVN